MEVGVRLIGILLRLLNMILTPLLWAFSRGQRRRLPPPPLLLTRSAVDLAAAIRNGELSSEELVLTCINHVKEVDPLLNAVVDERFKAALDEAMEVDRLLAEARKSGTLQDLVKTKPLLGVPFTVKQSCSLTGMTNSVGCLEYAGRKATADGLAVSRVKAAGAIPVLVSNTPELCLGWESTNLLQGTTNNPYSLDRTAGGSSGGEGALLGSGASLFGVGSDIAGSIRLPATFCGVYGHKPTAGVIPIAGHIPMLTDHKYSSYLAVGPMAKRAADLPLLTQLMAGERAADLRLDEPVNLGDLKVYYTTEGPKSIALIPVHRSIKDAILNAAKYLQRECGATVREVKFEEMDDAVEIAVSAFFSMKDIPNLMQDPANPKRERNFVVELLKVVFGGASRSLQGLGFTFLAKTKLFIPDSRRAHYSAKEQRLRDNIQRTLGPSGVLLFPAFSDVSWRHHNMYSRLSGVVYTMIFNILGLPATAVPLHTHRGLPVGIQVIAAPYQDRLCLAVAKQLEIGFGGWHPPQ